MKFEFDKEVSKDTFALLSRNQERQTCFQSRARDFISSSVIRIILWRFVVLSTHQSLQPQGRGFSSSGLPQMTSSSTITVFQLTWETALRTVKWILNISPKAIGFMLQEACLSFDIFFACVLFNMLYGQLNKSYTSTFLTCGISRPVYYSFTKKKCSMFYLPGIMISALVISLFLLALFYRFSIYSLASSSLY